MIDYFAIKTLHILSATLMFGTGFGTAFYMFFANRSGNVAAIAVVTRWVARADWWFTTPAVIIQPLSGWWLMRQLGWELGWNWVGLTLLLYAIAGACWLPVVWLQLKMRDMAQSAHAEGHELPARYWTYERWWTVLGFPAFGGLLVVYWLMVAKPF
ncbi:DUF2269 family protein [Chitinolyticbacter albus]|uniref:DUF2269 family protein n=1 Tax=Chitinolyticbacter albus TaxID=2961951 RepID=UPI00210AB186|nr:DUF2269 domain-containing protein [Chitinolyticbacter albus]